MIYLLGLFIGAASELASTSYLESEYSEEDGVGPFGSLGIMVWPILLVIDIGIILSTIRKEKLEKRKSQITDDEYQAL